MGFTKMFCPRKVFAWASQKCFARAKCLHWLRKNVLPVQRVCSGFAKMFCPCKGFAGASQKCFVRAKGLQGCRKSYREKSVTAKSIKLFQHIQKPIQ
jgi:hypothetical protein